MELILYPLNINGENNQLLPSILKTYRVGGIFIHSCNLFYARFTPLDVLVIENRNRIKVYYLTGFIRFV